MYSIYVIHANILFEWVNRHVWMSIYIYIYIHIYIHTYICTYIHSIYTICNTRWRLVWMCQSSCVNESHMNCRVCMSHTHELSCVDESCRTYECVISQEWTSHVTHTNNSGLWCDAYSLNMRDVTHSKCMWHDLCDMTHVAHIWRFIHVWQHLCRCDMTPSHVWRDAFICVAWWYYCMCHITCESVMCGTGIIHMCGVAHSYAWHDKTTACVTSLVNQSYVWHDSLICAAWRIHMRGMMILLCVSRDSWLSHVCDRNHSYVWRNAFICVASWYYCVCHMTRDSVMCVTWLVHMCGVTHSYVWHDDTTVCVTWFVTQSCVWHKPFLRGRLVHAALWSFQNHLWICDTTHHMCAAWHIDMCGMSHSYLCHASFICVTCLIHMRAMTHS